MIDYILDIVTIGKYILAIIGIIGVFLLLTGLIKSRRELITRGSYLIILAIVLGICGYFIYNATLDKAEHKIYETLDAIQYQDL